MRSMSMAERQRPLSMNCLLATQGAAPHRRLTHHEEPNLKQRVLIKPDYSFLNKMESEDDEDRLHHARSDWNLTRGPPRLLEPVSRHLTPQQRDAEILRQVSRRFSSLSVSELQYQHPPVGTNTVNEFYPKQRSHRRSFCGGPGAATLVKRREHHLKAPRRVVSSAVGVDWIQQQQQSPQFYTNSLLIHRPTTTHSRVYFVSAWWPRLTTLPRHTPVLMSSFISSATLSNQDKAFDCPEVFFEMHRQNKLQISSVWCTKPSIFISKLMYHFPEKKLRRKKQSTFDKVDNTYH